MVVKSYQKAKFDPEQYLLPIFWDIFPLLENLYNFNMIFWKCSLNFELWWAAQEVMVTKCVRTSPLIGPTKGWNIMLFRITLHMLKGMLVNKSCAGLYFCYMLGEILWGLIWLVGPTFWRFYTFFCFLSTIYNNYI